MKSRAVRCSLVAAMLWASISEAQGVRITGTSVMNYFELRPVAEDSIADSLATGTGLVRHSAIGLVSCPEGQSHCYFYRSLERRHTMPVTQDFEVSGWGLGQGVSAYAHVRARAHAGGAAELWAREDDRFDAFAAYLEVDRDRWLARAGRQWLPSQLGVNNFDGVSLSLRSGNGLVVGGYAGASLILGLSEPPTNGALAVADVLPPDVHGWLFGATAQWRTTPALSLGAEYQREIRGDRAGFYSERVALDGALLIGQTSITADVQVDLASTALNELHVRASRALARSVRGSFDLVHSTPFFPLWTIWGVFSPVGYNEARAGARWQSAASELTVAISGGYRRYQETHTGLGFLPLRNDGWTTIATGGWRFRPDLDFTASYRRDIGFGASKSDGNAGIRWQRGGAWLGVNASATQNIFEFRIASGYLAGASVDGGLPLTPQVRLSGQAGIYRQVAANTPSTTVNWSQRRAIVQLAWAFGEAGRR